MYRLPNRPHRKTSPEPAKADGKAEEKAEEKAEGKPRRKDKKEAEKLKEELEKAKADLAALNDRYLRLRAEYDNFRKRTEREKAAIYDDATAAAVTDILMVADNLERALALKPAAPKICAKGWKWFTARWKRPLPN